MPEMQKNSGPRRKPSPLENAGLTPRYMPLSLSSPFLGLTRCKLYALLGSGEIRAVKVGKRTLIDIEHALAWLGSLPPARFGKQS